MSDSKKKKDLQARKARDREAREKAIRERRKLTAREKIHEIIFGADTFWGATFDVVLLVVIVLSIIVICLETVPGLGEPETLAGGVHSTEPLPYRPLLEGLHWAFTIFFTIEYLLRIYCVKRPMRYIFSFWGIIDLVSFLPDYLLLGFPNTKTSFFSVVRSLRLLRVFRIFKLGWMQNEADDLGNAIWRARAKIVVFLTGVMIIVTVTGTLMYEIEKTGAPETNQFRSIPESIYWAIVTMTTVGFGDIVPKTVLGKFLSACLILIGYSLIIVPTGFVSAEIIDSKRKKRKAAKEKFISTRSCSSCVTEGHDEDAIYCKFCGEML
jgi:voltage-gated potassium channel